MTIELLGSIITAALSAGALIIVAIINRDARRNHDRDQQQQQRRERELRLSMEVTAATLDLADVIAIAHAGGELNGNVEAAREKAAKARAAYEDFLRDEVSALVSK